MTDAALLECVKKSLGVTGEYQDDTLQFYIDEVKEYLLDGGVKPDVLAHSCSVGVVARGVADLWNYGAGNAELSPYFMQRAKQLVYKDVSEPEPPEPDPELAELTLTSVMGHDYFYTVVTVTGAVSTPPLYRYKVLFRFNESTLPTYHQDLTDWTEWDGVSEIYAEDYYELCVCEVDENNQAIARGTVYVISI